MDGTDLRHGWVQHGGRLRRPSFLRGGFSCAIYILYYTFLVYAAFCGQFSGILLILFHAGDQDLFLQHWERLSSLSVAGAARLGHIIWRQKFR